MPAVTISTVYIVTAGIWRNPVKYFTDKKCRALAKISQNPASNALQVLELDKEILDIIMDFDFKITFPRYERFYPVVATKIS